VKVKGPGAFGYSPDLLPVLNPKADLLYAATLWKYPSWAALQWAERTGKPMMVAPHGSLDAWALRNAVWKKRIAAALFKNRQLNKAACLRALCQSEADAFRAYGLTQPIAIIPNGVALPTEEQEMGDGRWEIGGYTQPSTPRTLLFLGRIHPKKGLVNLIRAFAQSRGSRVEGREPWRLVIAGWDQGGHEAELIQLCEELGLKSAVTDAEQRPGQLKLKVEGERRALDARHSSLDSAVLFFGPAFGRDKEDLLRSADAFVLPSFSEGLPMSVLEGWSYGLPVVMTPECNLPEGFAADAAIRIETSVESIAEGLGTLFSMNDADLMTMGAKGRGLVDERFTWKSVASQMREVYDWMLGGGVAPSSVIMK
jgi:poly(glycerol-phosphate) alpha-glucosyltransferase